MLRLTIFCAVVAVGACADLQPRHAEEAAERETAAAGESLWRRDTDAAIAEAQQQGHDLVAFFALPGREMSDGMEANTLADPGVRDSLQRNRFATVWVDGFVRKDLYGRWIGGGEGTGIAIVDPQGRCWAARPGPQDPDEFVALLDNAAAARPRIADTRAALKAMPEDAEAQQDLGDVLLELGCRVESAALLRAAATSANGPRVEARHRLARLYALDGAIAEAEEWLRGAPISPGSRVTAGYVLYKKRRYVDAARVLSDAIETDGITEADRQRAQLYRGKALAHGGRDRDALAVFKRLAAENSGSIFEAAARHSLAHFDGTSFHAADRPHRH